MLITNVATDSDVPTQTLTAQPADRASQCRHQYEQRCIDVASLVIHANSTNGFTVRVTDSGTPNLSATQSFTVTVTNLAGPTVTNVTLNQGMLVMQVNGANGPDYEADLDESGQLESGLYDHHRPCPCLEHRTTNGPLGFFRIVVGPPRLDIEAWRLQKLEAIAAKEQWLTIPK